MPSYCSAFGCQNSSSKADCIERKISFHKFPMENKDLLRLWIAAMKRDNFVPTIHTKICSQHFTPDSFEYQNYTNRRIIKNCAVPSIFRFKPKPKKKTPPKPKTRIPRTRSTCFCSAPGCNNFSNRKSCLEKNVTFHPFPLKNEVLLGFWLVQMNNPDFTPDTASCLCSEHFEEDCFYIQSGNKLLEKCAVPTKFRCYNNKESLDSSGIEPGICTMPTVLHIQETKKRKHEDSDHNINLNNSFQKHMFTTTKDVSVQTAISGISTQLVLQASSSDYLPILLGSKDTGAQTEMDGISALLTENTSLQNALAELREKVDTLTFRVEKITDDTVMKPLTGFSGELFESIFEYLFLPSKITPYNNMSPYNQFFAFAIYMRTGISQFFISILFKLNQASISRIINTVSKFLYDRTKAIKIWPSREQIDEKTSPVFFRHYPNCRVILESAEFQIQRPSDAQTRQLTFSAKKNTFTVKGLIGKTPTGAISFISDVWPGSISDKVLFQKSGILELLEPDDLVIADKSFDIRDELEEKGCYLCAPKFLSDRIVFNREEQVLYPEYTHHRIHYDLASSKYNKFKFFDGPITTTTFDIMNEYIYIVGFLINYGKPLIHIRQH